MFYETAKRDHGLPHDPLKGCVVPRPIGWITSVDRRGAVNLAPFSFFNMLTDLPPMVMYCQTGSHIEGGRKDSIKNVEETGEFVANIATWDLREKVNITSAAVARDIDEMKLAGLTPAPSNLVRPPRVKESPIHFECVLDRLLELPPRSEREPNIMVIGRVIGVHIADEVIRDGRVDIGLVEPIARLGYDEYAVIRDIFRLDRPADVETSGSRRPRLF
ncbi:flavin reductase family protein [Parvibaculum sp.]|uniref:flavin reductase family protein n=1 Tax=Parvibaculum sp. TaxID=2024848 RepID=UPI001DA8A126|nr:flavin reductase family protein [Parvibaculum sp.]MBX3490344.1 flavin reductase family protein [Parvibaculum sp.]